MYKNVLPCEWTFEFCFRATGRLRGVEKALGGPSRTGQELVVRKKGQIDVLGDVHLGS